MGNQAPTNSLIGEVSLPHQPSDFKPEEIIEIEQEALTEIINDQDRHLADLHDRVNQAVSLLQAETQKAQTASDQMEKLVRTHQAKHHSDPAPPTTITLSVWSKLKKSLFPERRPQPGHSLSQEADLHKIINFVKKNGHITKNEVKTLANVNTAQARHYLHILVKNKQLSRYGHGQLTFYKLTS